MAFPSIRSSAITGDTVIQASHVINLPATISVGDTIFVFLSSTVAGAITWPNSTWNEMFDSSPHAGDDQLAAAWKKAEGNEGGTTITVTAGSGRMTALAISVQDAADPESRPPELSTVATGSATQPNATTCTPTGGAKDYLWYTFFAMEGEATGITNYPTSYTLSQSGFANTGTAGGVGTNCVSAGAGRQLNAASEDAGVWNIAGTLDDWAAWTVVFHPFEPFKNSRVSQPIYIPPKPPISIAILTLTVNLLQSTLAPTVEPPFFPIDYPNPQPIKRINPVWTQDRPQYYIDEQPKNQYDWPIPVLAKIIAKTHIDNLLNNTLVPIIAPFAQIDWPNPAPIKNGIIVDISSRLSDDFEIAFSQKEWPNPLPRKTPGYTWISNSQENVLAPVEAPPIIPFDISIPKIGRKPTETWVNNNQENTLAPAPQNPFIPVAYPNPAPKFRLIVDTQSTPEFPTVGNPFKPVAYPNPIPKKIADNRTYINTLLPQNFIQTPTTVSNPNPITRQYPISNRTWIWKQQEEFNPGDPFIAKDQPNPRYKARPVRDWTWSKPSYYVNPTQSSCPIMLGIGAPGDITCFVLTGLEANPQPITVPTNLPTLETPIVVKPRPLTWLQSRPFFYVDGFSPSISSTNLPIAKRRDQNRGFIQSRPVYYTEPAIEQIRTQIWNNPVIPRKGLIIESETRSGDPFTAGTPNRQRDWPNPILRKKQGRDWIDYVIFDQNLPIQPLNVFNNISFRKRLIAQTWIQVPLVASPISTPVGEQLETIQIRKRRLEETWINPSLSAEDKPVISKDFPNPRTVKYLIDWTHARPQYYEDIQPFAKSDWPNPLIKFSAVKDWINFIQIEEINPIFPFDLLNPIIGRKQTESWIINLLQSTLEPGAQDIPFAQNDYPNPALIKIGKGWEWARPYYYEEPIDPFRQSYWQNPFLIVKSQVVHFIHFIPISEDPRAVQLLEVPIRKAPNTETWIQNLQESALGPIPQTSLTQKDWPNPLRGNRSHVGFTDSVAHLIKGNVPFIFSEDKLPVKRIVVPAFEYSAIVVLEAVIGDTPFSQRDWPVVRRIKFPDIYTINGVNYIVLPQIEGRSICMLSALTEYDLLSELEIYEIDSKIEEYDIDSGGTECE